MSRDVNISYEYSTFADKSVPGFVTVDVVLIITISLNYVVNLFAIYQNNGEVRNRIKGTCLKGGAFYFFVMRRNNLYEKRNCIDFRGLV